MPEKLVYRAPPAEKTPRRVSRRVYVLPVSLVRRIHDYGFRHGHQSEVSAVRELLEIALSNAGIPFAGGSDA